MPKMVEFLKADKGTDEETKAKGELESALKAFDDALGKKVLRPTPGMNLIHQTRSPESGKLVS